MPLQTKSSVGLNFNLNCAKNWQFNCRHSDPSKVDFQRRKEGNFKGESKSAPTGQGCCNILCPVWTCTMGCAPFGKVCTLACCQLRRPASAAAPSVAHSCPQLPTSPHSIAKVLLERRCCGRYLSFRCQVQYPVSCSFSCDTLPVPDQTYGAVWIRCPFESICCQDTFIRSIDNCILKAHCQLFFIQISGLTDKTCRQISQTSDLSRWCSPNMNNRPSMYTVWTYCT